MPLLSDRYWKIKYTLEDGDLLNGFYIPALECAVRYDRTTGYFTAGALAAAARGVEELIRNRGRMRLIVGCTLAEAEVQAISKGESLRRALDAKLCETPLKPQDQKTTDALELLAWMVAKGYLDVKAAVPCTKNRRPLAGQAIFHEKTGIIEDKTGDRLAFNGSINETENGWRHNWDSFHVFTSWSGTVDHVDAEEKSFQSLWADQAKTALVVDIPRAFQEELFKFMPPSDTLPKRLTVSDVPGSYGDTPTEETEAKPEPATEPRKVVWQYIKEAPSQPDGGERVGEATSAVTPWPHQIRAFQRMYDAWPPKLLIADEVGLGKTIQAGMLLRQAWLAGKARRILVLAPKAVLKQWQIELREKFNLNWPIYDGNTMSWYPSPAYSENCHKKVSRAAWHQEPCVLSSSHLMRRQDRTQELLQDADPWDVIVLDEAHHARRRSGGLGTDDRPNLLLRLMQRLKDRTQGLILLTATPMQVSPIEVWDLLNLFDMPGEWSAEAFLRFFEEAAQPMPGNTEMASMAAMFRAIENAYGQVLPEEAQRYLPSKSKLKAKKVLRALRDTATIPLRQLETPERKAAVRIMKANTPIRRLISRHTRELLRRYAQEGKLTTRIATRRVEDRFVTMTEAERHIYQDMEQYISSTYNNTSPDKRTAMGFVMTIYRRRLASSFWALQKTLQQRVDALERRFDLGQRDVQQIQEDVLDDELAEEVMDAQEAAELETASLASEEWDDIHSLLQDIKQLDPDTKAQALKIIIQELREQGYPQVMVFTQYTDSMDFLRQEIIKDLQGKVICFSGRGGEVLDSTGQWRLITRDDTKKMFANRQAEIMLCTDAAAEGLNFQFCGAIVNYDMPWNPMKVEQRIGRIDRLGQEFEQIRIVNLHYENTVEADIYLALRDRIELFQTFVGRLQPILAKLPRAIAEVTLGARGDQENANANLIAELDQDVREAASGGLDLDEVTDQEIEAPLRPTALYGLNELGAVLERPDLLPPGLEVKKVGSKDYSYIQPGMKYTVRVTTDPDYYDQNPDST
ncbi:MAG: DEAD/DEAH box helicase family protein, partial [Desulfohalobiaceae bacterium]|nr:DEAD/DEAH box helicase family protein [Desulfohalobiaceae bacterium]